MPAGIFVGVIGGPPCQWASTALHWQGHNVKHRPENLIPEFVRIKEEAEPEWSVMENLLTARKSPGLPEDWLFVKLRDWDCGGLTHRKRAFWVWPPTLIFAPPKRPGKPEYSVLKNSGRQKLSLQQRRDKTFRTHEKPLTLKQAAELQGWPEMAEILKDMSAAYAVGLLGNGVPRAMGTYIAKAIKGVFYVE